MSVAATPRSALLPALALAFNALVWGCSWWPLRQFERLGLHPLWTTLFVYVTAMVVIIALRPRAVMQVLRSPALWVLVLAAGTTNATFNWAVVIGDVVRVVLLFYLMPLWTVLLAHALLNERLNRHAGVRVALALVGAAIVLWPPERTGWDNLPVPRSLPDWLGVLGGLSFALNNVMLRREARRPEEGRALAMFFGGALVSGVLATLLAGNAQVPWPPAPAWPWMAGALALAAAFLAGNLALQFGASRLPANVTSVVMLTEVVFASASALWLGGGTLSGPLLVGGGLILAAALLSAFEPQATP